MQQVIQPIHFPKTKTTIVQAIYTAIEKVPENNLSLAEVMGYTAHAFRININPKSAEIAGPTSYHGGLILKRSLRNLGFDSLILDPHPVQSITPQLLSSIIANIRQSIDRGIPVIGWDFFEKEFGVIYGYDETLQVLYAKDGKLEGPIPYDLLTNRRILCLAVIQNQLETNKRIMLHDALEMIISHGNGNDGLSFGKCWHGLKGYDAWISAFEQGKISASGNGYNVSVISDARKQAVSFLEELTGWDDGSPVSMLVKQLAEKAIPHYSNVVEVFDRLAEDYPYPNIRKGLNPRLKENVSSSIQLLCVAREAEERGLLALTEMYRIPEIFNARKQEDISSELTKNFR